MEDQELRASLQQLFPVLKQTELLRAIVEQGTLHTLPPGKLVFDVGGPVTFVPLILSGAVKVFREDDNGHELFLYYIAPGQSCAMTFASCLSRSQSSVKATVMEETQILALPNSAVYSFRHQFPTWNDFVVQTYTARFNEILEVMDHIAFYNLDIRLMRYLVDKSNLHGVRSLKITNTEIAKDLNSSREVISRLLKQMEKKGMLSTERGVITLLA